jgi:hypothetical protein
MGCLIQSLIGLIAFNSTPVTICIPDRKLSLENHVSSYSLASIKPSFVRTFPFSDRKTRFPDSSEMPRRWRDLATVPIDSAPFWIGRIVPDSKRAKSEAHPQIYVKESDMRSIPRVFNHRLAPFLFAEKGEMLNSKGGKNPTIV